MHDSLSLKAENSLNLREQTIAFNSLFVFSILYPLLIETKHMKKIFFNIGGAIFDFLPDPTGELKASLHNGQKTFLLVKVALLFPFFYLSLYLICS